ncbi:MAG: glycosyltransferase family 4 protein [Oscillospiraceae bacterium]|jgi:glycosyltransferase involved in cell wall biosynthesis
MKIFVYECSAGFTSYTGPLSAALAEKVDNQITLITVENNPFLSNLSPKVRVRAALHDLRKGPSKHSIAWVFNRMAISVVNIVRRNKMVKKEKPDIVSIQFTIPILDQFFLKGMKRHSKVIYTAHDVIPPNRSRFWSMKSLSRIYHTADSIVVHSEANAKQLMERFSIAKEKIKVVHHGIATDYEKLERAQCRQAIGVDNDTPVFLFYGSIREQKGLDDLIRSLEGLDCLLIVAGAMPYGESFAPYEELISACGVRSFLNIEHVSDEMTNLLFQAADVIALPYKYFYSQSGVFMQAIQYSKYVLVTDVGSFREYIEQWQFGCLCNPKDVQSMRQAALELIGWIKQKKGLPLAEAAKEANSWEQAADKHAKIFESELNH